MKGSQTFPPHQVPEVRKLKHYKERGHYLLRNKTSHSI